MQIERKKNKLWITERTSGYKSKAKVIQRIKEMFEFKRKNPKKFLQ